MVRFSDLLGGNDTPEEPEEEGDAAQDGLEPAEDVLERLTQFATSARASSPPPVADAPAAGAPLPDPEPTPAPEPDADPAAVPDAQADAPPVLTPGTDDLLPRGKSGKSRKRGR